MNGFLRALRVVVDRVRDQLLARARLAADEHRRAARRDLRDLLVHLTHRSTGADEVRELVPLLQLEPQVGVFVEETAALRFGEPRRFHRLCRHRRDDLEEAHELLVLAVLLQLQLDAERADGRAAVEDRRADEAGGHPLQAPAPCRTVEEERLAAHIGDDDRLRALNDAADDPLADSVAGSQAIGGDADPRLDRQLVGVGIAEDERRLHHVVMTLEHLEHAEERPVELFGGSERLRDVDQRLGAPKLRDAIAPQQDAGGRGRHVYRGG